MTDEEISESIGQAYELRGTGDVDTARELLLPLMSLSPPPVTALLLLADCIRIKDPVESNEAEPLLRLACKLSPDHPHSHLELAHWLFAHKDDNESAWALLGKAQKLIRRVSVSAALLEASLLEDEDRQKEAEQSLEQALRNNPDSKQLQERLSSMKRFLEKQHKDLED